MSIIGAHREKVVCDFCGNKDIVADLVNNCWRVGCKGYHIEFGKDLLCLAQQEVKHACSKSICQARLLVWASSV